MPLLFLGSSLRLGLLASVIFFLLDACSFLRGLLFSVTILLSLLLLSLFLGDNTLAICLILALFGGGSLFLLFLLGGSLIFGEVSGCRRRTRFLDTFNDISVGATIGLTPSIGGLGRSGFLFCWRWVSWGCFRDL